MSRAVSMNAVIQRQMAGELLIKAVLFNVEWHKETARAKFGVSEPTPEQIEDARQDMISQLAGDR